MTIPPSEFELGKEAGRVAQLLDEHSKHLRTINGSVADSARTLADLASEVRQLGEDARLREERLIAAATALAAETEKRRSALADTVSAGDRHFTRRERVVATIIAMAVLALGVYAAFKGI